MPHKVEGPRGRYEQAPRLEIIPPHPQQSFRSMTHDYPSPICGWGFHPEYEIHLITQTTGSFIAGDYIGTFEPGHVSFMGGNLPHDWVSDLDPGVVVQDRDAVIQFTEEWIQECMSVMPEALDLAPLLQESLRGLQFTGETAKRAGELILSIAHGHGIERISHFFSLLTLLSHAPADEKKQLGSEWLAAEADPDSQDAVQAGLNYIFENLTGDIRLAKAAQLAYMSEPTFSKYFRRAAGMTFSDMVKKLRVAQAKRLLDTTRDPVTVVATASGYKNLANFNRQFLAEVGMTPSAYRNLEKAAKPLPTLLARETKAKATS